jgi:hypothetical protein
MDAVLDLVNVVFNGSLPPWDALRASCLIPLHKWVDRVRLVQGEECDCGL